MMNFNLGFRYGTVISFNPNTANTSDTLVGILDSQFPRFLILC